MLQRPASGGALLFMGEYAMGLLGCRVVLIRKAARYLADTLG